MGQENSGRLKECPRRIRISYWEGPDLADTTSVNDRKYPRVRIDADVSVAHTASPEASGRAFDLSLGGIRFMCVELEAKLGDMVGVCLNLDGIKLTLEGKVVRVTEMDDFVREVALAFVDIDSFTRQVLDEYMERAHEDPF